MKQAAKFYGICQGCERRQKLPGDVLALHGYELSHGFFNGVCFGAGHAPYEKSCALIESCIERAKAQAVVLHDRADKVLASASLDADKAWRHCYMPALSSRSKGSVYVWQEVPIEVVQEGEYQALYQVVPARSSYAKNGVERVRLYEKKARVIADGAMSYAAHLRHQAEQAEAYAVRQAARIANWQPRELQPVAGKAVAA